jgi:hypothetical protein
MIELGESPSSADTIDWPGVVVVGGGATGILTAIYLRDKGEAVLLLESRSLCSGQTGKCHGWIHRGSVFPDASQRDVEDLQKGASAWRSLATSSGDEPFTPEAVVAGVGSRTRRQVEQACPEARSGAADDSDLPELQAVSWKIRTAESAIVPRDVLRAALARAEVVPRRAEALGFVGGPGVARRAETLVVRGPEGRLVGIKARGYVLAAAWGVPKILANQGDCSTRRLSFMLVARSPHLFGRPFAIPERRSLGVFGVPRSAGNSRYLLISNFISYSVRTDLEHALDTWLSGIEPVLRSNLPGVWRDQDARWGVYPAIKTEPAREQTLGVPQMRRVETGYSNVVAGLTGKLTLAPMLAGQLSAEVLRQSRDEPANTGGRLSPDALPAADWSPEEWEITPLCRRATLFGGGDD